MFRIALKNIRIVFRKSILKLSHLTFPKKAFWNEIYENNCQIEN